MAGIDSADSPGAGFDGFTSGFGTAGSYANHGLTNFYLPFIADARNNSSVLWNMIEKVHKEPTSGRFIVWPTRTTRNTGRGAIRPDGQLPDPGSQGLASCFTETRTYMGRIKVAGELLRRGKTNGGAFMPIEPLELEGQMDDIAVDFNRMVQNDGSGRMAEFNTGATTVFTLRVNQSIEGAATCLTRPTLYLEVGDRVAFAVPGTDSLRAITGGVTGQNAAYVVSIINATDVSLALTPGGAAIATSTVTSLTQGDFLVRASADANTDARSSGRRSEIMGIEGIFGDSGVLDGLGAAGLGTATAWNQHTGTYDQTVTSLASAGFQGNPATASFPWNQAVVLDNGSSGARSLSEELLQQAFSDAEERNNAQIDLLYSGYATYNSYVKLLTPDKRFNDTLELRGGHKLLSFNGVGWVKDRFAYANRVKGINLGELAVYETEPLKTLNYLGVGGWERLQDKDAYWMGHVSSQQFVVRGVRQRVGFNLVDLAA